MIKLKRRERKFMAQDTIEKGEEYMSKEENIAAPAIEGVKEDPDLFVGTKHLIRIYLDEYEYETFNSLWGKLEEVLQEPILENGEPKVIKHDSVFSCPPILSDEEKIVIIIYVEPCKRTTFESLQEKLDEVLRKYIGEKGKLKPIKHRVDIVMNYTSSMYIGKRSLIRIFVDAFDQTTYESLCETLQESLQEYIWKSGRPKPIRDEAVVTYAPSQFIGKRNQIRLYVEPCNLITFMSICTTLGKTLLEFKETNGEPGHIEYEVDANYTRAGEDYVYDGNKGPTFKTLGFLGDWFDNFRATGPDPLAQQYLTLKGE